jgi:hypothetical protein
MALKVFVAPATSELTALVEDVEARRPASHLRRPYLRRRWSIELIDG